MLRINNFNVSVLEKRPLEELVAEKLKIALGAVKAVRIVRKTLDARQYHGAPVRYGYVLDVTTELADKKLLFRHKRDKSISQAPSPMAPLQLKPYEGELKHRPVVVGFGPAGMFTALSLARAGCRPLVLERGQDVDSRHKAINSFWQGGPLDESSNVQFGEGGAGTFSDGKLTTRINDERMTDVLAAFVAAGAPEEIMYLHKPHIGTDLLRGIVKNIRQEIIRLGGTVRFGARVSDIEIKNGAIQAVIVNDEERIPAETVFMGIGHSARDTYTMLYNKGMLMEPKAFAIGVRIEHPQELIDRSQYGKFYGTPGLPVADYALTFKDKTGGRGAYSFCMCPGGQVVAAASEAGRVVTNGMSNYKRDSGVANSALLVTVGPEDYGGGVLDGIRLQRECEARAFDAGGKNYFAPVQTVGDFLTGRQGSQDFLVKPTYCPGIKPADLHACLPSYVTRAMEAALPFWNNKIPGFADPTAPMTGVETRSSAPCRLVRDRTSYQAAGVAGLYPTGEGAGYAGGIMSAAVDGMNAALAFLGQP